ncbi:MAG: hypothetical protein D6785_13415 [Planctomycetota bacterium]|nr:MAG: hypothetical protein D6785_13415 [Planctomycetota bacterium]
MAKKKDKLVHKFVNSRYYINIDLASITLEIPEDEAKKVAEGEKDEPLYELSVSFSIRVLDTFTSAIVFTDALSVGARLYLTEEKRNLKYWLERESLKGTLLYKLLIRAMEKINYVLGKAVGVSIPYNS